MKMKSATPIFVEKVVARTEKLKVGSVKLWKEVKTRNRQSGRRMSDAIFVAKKVSGRLKIGDKKEIDRAAWCKPRGIRLTATSRYIRDKLFPR